MSTPVAERVRQFRERQRQANPREPFWPDLTGKLSTTAIWLDLGNPAPATFIDAIQVVATKVGLLKVTEELEQLPCAGYHAMPDVDNKENAVRGERLSPLNQKSLRA